MWYAQSYTTRLAVQIVFHPLNSQTWQLRRSSGLDGDIDLLPIAAEPLDKQILLKDQTLHVYTASSSAVDGVVVLFVE
jgi:hypothetical protein